MKRCAPALALVAALVGCKGGSSSHEPYNPPTDLAPGEEWIPAGEDQAIAESLVMLEDFVKANFDASGFAHRDAHVKAHGCVKAKVTINEGLSEELAVGLFAEAKSYDAWIRFSSSADHWQRDRRPDGRGMAIKLMNVAGDKALPQHQDETSHDIVLINYPVFVVKDARDYVEFTHDSTIGHPLRFFFHEGRSYLPELTSAGKLALQRVVSPLSPTYYSMTPYLFGEGMAVKYGARPCEKDSRRRRKLGKDYLRKQLVKDLGEHGGCFELMVQRQIDPERMPIEDPTVEWPPALSPYLPVARIEIPEQDFNTPQQNELCEYLSFNPWHAKVEHRPLGGINRVRKVVYIAISNLRHHLDGVKSLEPTDHDVEAYLGKLRD